MAASTSQTGTNSMSRSHSGYRSDLSMKCQAASSLQAALNLARAHAAGIKYGMAMPLESVEMLGDLISE